VVKLARWYGSNKPTLHRYRDQFLKGGKSALFDGWRDKRAIPRDQWIERAAPAMAKANPGYGEKRIAVVGRREAGRVHGPLGKPPFTVNLLQQILLDDERWRCYRQFFDLEKAELLSIEDGDNQMFAPV